MLLSFRRGKENRSDKTWKIAFCNGISYPRILISGCSACKLILALKTQNINCTIGCGLNTFVTIWHLFSQILINPWKNNFKKFWIRCLIIASSKKFWNQIWKSWIRGEIYYFVYLQSAVVVIDSLLPVYKKRKLFYTTAVKILIFFVFFCM